MAATYRPGGCLRPSVTIRPYGRVGARPSLRRSALADVRTAAQARPLLAACSTEDSDNSEGLGLFHRRLRSAAAPPAAPTPTCIGRRSACRECASAPETSAAAEPTRRNRPRSPHPHPCSGQKRYWARSRTRGDLRRPDSQLPRQVSRSGTAPTGTRGSAAWAGARSSRNPARR